ncbi:MAG: BatA and WFA domain-containing protein [Verrucomicrobiota bacterium]
MSFTIIHQLFLWLLPLASLPILFHLFFRIKKRPRPFPSLMFFHRIDPKLSSRRRIMEYLILLLRTLLILFLLLALSKIVWFGAGSSGSIAMVVMVDNSGSMSGRFKGEQTKLKVAVDGAQALIASLQPKDSAGIVLLVEDVSVPLPPGLIADKTALKTGLSHIKETEASGSAAQALSRAVALLESSAATRYEIHIFSDLQEVEWTKSVSLRNPRAGTVVIVHRIPTQTDREGNASLVGVRLPERKILAGRKIPLTLDLANAGELEVRGRLNWSDDQGNKGLTEFNIPARSEKSAAMLLDPLNPGLHWVNVWFEGDSFAADNKASLAFSCMDKRLALFIGAREEFGLLPTALSPSGDGKFTGLVPDYVEPAAMNDAILDRKPVLLVIPWHNLPARQAERQTVQNFIEQGGNVLIVPSTSSADPARGATDWIGASTEPLIALEQGLPMLAFKPDAPVYADLRNTRGELVLRGLKAFKFLPLKVTEQVNPLMGLEDGRVLLAQRKKGKGTVFYSGVAMDPTWSTLPLKGGSLALLQNMALAGEEMPDLIVSLVAGERLVQVPEDSPAMEIKTISGSVIEWKGESANRPVFPRTGVYAVTAGKKMYCVAVRSSSKEGVRQFIASDKVPALAGLSYGVRNFSDAESVAAEARKMQSSLDTFLPFLLLALLALGVEGWLANQPPRKPTELSVSTMEQKLSSSPQRG